MFDSLKGVNMGHNISGFIGNKDIILEMSDILDEKCYDLNQGFAIIFLNDALYDSIERNYSFLDSKNYPEFEYFSDKTYFFMKDFSQSGKLAYIETEYFGGVGTQSAILLENGELKIKAVKTEDTKNGNKERAINEILKGLGVEKTENEDEFQSIGLGKYRHNVIDNHHDHDHNHDH